MTNGLIHIQEDGVDLFEASKERNRILGYLGNISMIVWRIMTSLEYKQPIKVRKGLVKFNN